jgi:hypothetical protein
MPVHDPDVSELLRGLATAIANAEQLIGGLEGASTSGAPSRRPGGPAAAQQAPVESAPVEQGRVESVPAEQGLVEQGLERRLAAAENDRRELSARLVEAERRAERLMTLYVATYHLHAALDPAGVEAAIAEIAVDLLGARRFVLLLEEEGGGCRVAMDRTAGHRGDHGGLEGESAALFAGRRYTGGDPMIDATLADGVLRMTPIGEAADDTVPAAPRGPVATVPLNLGGQTAGVLVVLELFAHKRGLTTEDRDLLDLLAAHAASALTAAQLFSVSERRLRTYKSLIELARR